MGVQIPHGRDNFQGRAAHCQRDAAWVVDAGAWAQGSMYLGAWGATTITEPSMCSGDAAFLSNYFDHLLFIQLSRILLRSVCVHVVGVEAYNNDIAVG